MGEKELITADGRFTHVACPKIILKIYRQIRGDARTYSRRYMTEVVNDGRIKDTLVDISECASG
jgi:hypothetical protein